jgi:para-nitrobenzyl esterase
VTVASTSVGALRGDRRGGVDAFLGVPYAQPPVGPLRWRPPEAVEPWAGERDATRHGPIAPQAISAERLAKRGQTMGEDCLHLNIWTPAADDARRPVLAFVHGGGVVAGTGSAPLLDGAALAARGDIVVVALNFRLGALGSLVAGWSATNLALRDQLAALGWIRREIGAFGGDPAAVTVAGQSSGAVAVACMLASEAATGLFDRAILQSGGLERVRSREAAAAVGRRFGAALPGAADAGLDDILAAQATVPTGYVPPEGPWHHSVDGDVVAEHPLVAVARRPLAPVPVLGGTTAEEWRAFDAALPDEAFGEDDLRTRARALLGDGHLLDDVLDRYRATYPDGDAAAQRRAVASALVTDFHFAAPTEQLLRHHAARGNPVHRYELQWPSPKPGLGACHDTCLPLLFGTTSSAPALVGDDAGASRMSAAVQDAWITFVRGGEPWARYDERRRPTLLLGREPHLAEQHRRDRLDVWEGRFPAAG